MAEFGGRCRQCCNHLWQSFEEGAGNVVTSYGRVWRKVLSIMEPIMAEFGGRCRHCHNQLRQNLEEGAVSVITSYGRVWRQVPSVLQPVMVVSRKVPSVSDPVVAEFEGRCRQCRNQLWQSLEEGPGARGTNVDFEALKNKTNKKHQSFTLQLP